MIRKELIELTLGLLDLKYDYQMYFDEQSDKAINDSNKVKILSFPEWLEKELDKEN